MDILETWTEVLLRLRPILEQIFVAYGVSPDEAQEMVEEACLVLIHKRPLRQDPEGWLLRTILENCSKIAGRTIEDPPK